MGAVGIIGATTGEEMVVDLERLDDEDEDDEEEEEILEVIE